MLPKRQLQFASLFYGIYASAIFAKYSHQSGKQGELRYDFDMGSLANNHSEAYWEGVKANAKLNIEKAIFWPFLPFTN